MELYRIPWRLVPNKIVRYPGGREIDRFRGVTPAKDDGRPEAWVGSTISVVNAAEKGDPYDGRAEVDLPDGRRVYLFEAIEEDPANVLGAAHQKISGNNLGVLVKLLDAQYQLGLQCHPTRPYAKEHFNSDYGKEESWIVIGLRDDVPEPPYVYLGFKDDISREKFEALYYEGDVSKMEDCCHKIPVNVGDVFFVGAGLPHAIGAGCFVVEVQEPSDITVGWKRHGEMSEEEGKVYDERLLGAYIYDGCTYEENLKRWLITPPVIRSGAWGEESILIGATETDYFSCTKLEVQQGNIAMRNTGFIQIGIVTEGAGVLSYPGGEMPLKRGDEFFIPAGVEEMSLSTEDGITVMLSHPPGAQHQ
ncbi:MAG: class I mannose-6-phosphate isomerase [Christensenellaceae bacterium]|jgi:mannose-6-phosphate isomerase